MLLPFSGGRLRDHVRHAHARGGQDVGVRVRACGLDRGPRDRLREDGRGEVVVGQGRHSVFQCSREISPFGSGMFK